MAVELAADRVGWPGGHRHCLGWLGRGDSATVPAASGAWVPPVTWRRLEVRPLALDPGIEGPGRAEGYVAAAADVGRQGVRRPVRVWPPLDDEGVARVRPHVVGFGLPRSPGTELRWTARLLRLDHRAPASSTPGRLSRVRVMSRPVRTRSVLSSLMTWTFGSVRA